MTVSFDKGFIKGLLPFLSCSLHIAHNGFHKGIVCFGQDAQQLSFDLHWWFKASPCKVEDYKQLSDDLNSEHRGTIPFPETCRKQMADFGEITGTSGTVLGTNKKYFLKELPQKKDTRKTLPSNKRYMRIIRALRDFECETLTQIKFLLGVSPVFSEYLTIFQDERLVVHVLFPKMVDLLMTLNRRFMKPSAMDVNRTGSLAELDVSSSSVHLPLMEIDFGQDVILHLNSITSVSKRNELRNAMKESLIQMALYLQKSYLFAPSY